MRFIILFLLLCPPMSAHPHIFMEALIKLDMEGSLLRGINFEVNMDEMNSTLLAVRYSVGPEGNLISKEGNPLDASSGPVSRSELESYRVRFNGSEVEALRPVIKRVYMEDFYFTYDLYIPLNITVERGDRLSISIYDRDYYFDYYYDEYSLGMADGSSLPYDFTLDQNKDISFYMGLMNPAEYEVSF